MSGTAVAPAVTLATLALTPADAAGRVAGVGGDVGVDEVGAALFDEAGGAAGALADRDRGHLRRPEVGGRGDGVAAVFGARGEGGEGDRDDRQRQRRDRGRGQRRRPLPRRHRVALRARRPPDPHQLVDRQQQQRQRQQQDQAQRRVGEDGDVADPGDGVGDAAELAVGGDPPALGGVVGVALGDEPEVRAGAADAAAPGG